MWSPLGQKALKPSVRQSVVSILQARGISQRKSCMLAGLSRRAARYQPSKENETLVTWLRELAHQHIRYGYRRICALLRREGWTVNLKRVWRLWKQLGLQVPKKRPKQRRQGPSVDKFPLQAIAPNHILCRGSFKSWRQAQNAYGGR